MFLEMLGWLHCVRKMYDLGYYCAHCQRFWPVLDDGKLTKCPVCSRQLRLKPRHALPHVWRTARLEVSDSD